MGGNGRNWEGKEREIVITIELELQYTAIKRLGAGFLVSGGCLYTRTTMNSLGVEKKKTRYATVDVVLLSFGCGGR